MKIRPSEDQQTRQRRTLYFFQPAALSVGVAAFPTLQPRANIPKHSRRRSSGEALQLL